MLSTYLIALLLISMVCLTECFRLRHHHNNKIYSKRELDLQPRLAGGCSFDTKTSMQGNVCEKIGQDSKCSQEPKGDPKAKAASIAVKAAQEAKAASDAQNAAAEAAASQVKTELADKAMQSARAAEAALAGKQQIVEQLCHEQHEAESVVQEVSSSLQNTQTNAELAQTAAGEAKVQVGFLVRLIEAAKQNLGNIENVAVGAQQELTEKGQLLEAAKNRVETINQQLISAKQDFERTKQAAYKAACAAVEAKQKAQKNRRSACYPSAELGSLEYM